MGGPTGGDETRRPEGERGKKGPARRRAGRQFYPEEKAPAVDFEAPPASGDHSLGLIT